MTDFIHSVLAQDVALAAAASTPVLDLPVNPLSQILLTLKWTNGAAADGLATVLATISQIEVIFRGQAIISASMVDLVALYARQHGVLPFGENIGVVTEISTFTLPILLGKKAFDPEGCFPAVRKGELQLQITSTADTANTTTRIIQIETDELVDVTPQYFLKRTTHSKTPTATGWHDMELPIGNLINGIMFFSTTVPDAVSYDASVGQVSVMVDNVEQKFTKTNWETLHQMFPGQAPAWVQDTELGGQLFHASYAYMDLDPLGDDTFSLDTAGRSRVHLRINQEPAADAIRVIPVEKMMVA